MNETTTLFDRMSFFYKKNKIKEDRMPYKNLVSWNSMIFGYSHNNRVTDATELFDKMPQRDAFWPLMIEKADGHL